jgi:hypothetical protein
MKLILKPNEMILMAGSSNLRHNELQINGKLIVTNQRIYFRTLKREFQFCNKEINPEDISEMFYFNVMMVLPRGIKIKTKAGEELDFTVRNRSEWAKLITKMF